MKQIKLAVVGLGKRGTALLKLLLEMPDVKITALCDRYSDRVQTATDFTTQKTGHSPDGYTDYRTAVARRDIDAVLVTTSWTSHIEIAVAAMRAGKYTATEVGGATSLQECWDLVHTYEETGMPCMLLENCCYNREEMAILNMVKQGLFGEIIHCRGGYHHDLREEVATGREKRHYRFENYLHRNGELYPTHQLGPIAKILDINRGNRMVTLSAMSTKARGLQAWIADNLGGDNDLANTQFAQGDIVTTMIKCAGGESILLTHDTTLPRPYSRGLIVQGTKGIWMEDKAAVSLEGITPLKEGWDPHTWEPLEKHLDKYEHPLWKWYIKDGVRAGHGGMDYLVLRAFLEAVQNHSETPIDVYDAAAWMSITCLSEESVAAGGMPVAIPDFTNGKWINPTQGQEGKYSLDMVLK